MTGSKGIAVSGSTFSCAIRNTLMRLKAEGFDLAILSDAPQDAQTRVINKLGLDKFFSEVFTSGGLKVSKKKGMFNVVLEKLSAQPESVIMVGDSLERDIIPALAAHLNAIWLNEKRLPNQKGYLEISTLKQLPEKIEQLSKKGN